MLKIRRAQCVLEQTVVHISSMIFGSATLTLKLLLPTTILWPFVWTTWVSQYQKKHSPTHTYPDH